MAIYTQKCEHKWLKINNRGEGVGIKMPWVEKNRKINNSEGGGGRGGIIRDSRVMGKTCIKCNLAKTAVTEFFHSITLKLARKCYFRIPYLYFV